MKDAYENRASVKIRLTYEQIKRSGKHKILLSETQKEELDKSNKLKKGLILEIKYEQLKINHTGGFLPILFAALGAAGALIGGGAAVANAVINAKHQSAEEEEIKRHNREMEKIAIEKQAFGSGLKKAKKRRNRTTT